MKRKICHGKNKGNQKTNTKAIPDGNPEPKVRPDFQGDIHPGNRKIEFRPQGPDFIAFGEGNRRDGASAQRGAGGNPQREADEL